MGFNTYIIERLDGADIKSRAEVFKITMDYNLNFKIFFFYREMRLNLSGSHNRRQVYSKIEYSHKFGSKDIINGLGMILIFPIKIVINWNNHFLLLKNI